MKIYFCQECGEYTLGPTFVCEGCHSNIPDDSWAEVTEEELSQLDYVNEFDFPPGLPSWEYDVVRLKSDSEAGGLNYTTELLNRMGEKGWELVNIVPLGVTEGPRYGVFKRSWGDDLDYEL